MNKDIKDKWLELISIFKKIHPDKSLNLLPPATEADFKKFKSVAGFPFPDDLRTIYEINNGQDNWENGIFLGLEFISIDKMLKEWKLWQKIKVDTSEEDTKLANSQQYSVPKKTIKSEYINSKWIPFTIDGGGNHLGLDLDPDKNGNIGQVINFGADENIKFVFAKDLDGFLNICIGIYMDKNEYNKAKEQHPVDYLKQICYPKYDQRFSEHNRVNILNETKRELNTPEKYTFFVREYATLLDRQISHFEDLAEVGDLHNLASQMPALISLVNTMGYLRGQDNIFLNFRPLPDNQDEFYKYETHFEKRLKNLIDKLINSKEKDFYLFRINEYFIDFRS